MSGVSIPDIDKVFIEYVQLWQYNKVVANNVQCSCPFCEGKNIEI